MRSHSDSTFDPTQLAVRLVRPDLRHLGATWHARSRSGTLEAAPAGSTKPSDSAPERLCPRFGATGTSKTIEFLKEFNEFTIFVVSAPDASSELENAL